ncbi:MAG: spermidine/putrescine ABC transporter substrate-binding protein [Magnetococcales bacterium]|nr:spermidine/putrescine ABC transporter substrate-binding protein [Magnetococcales bacterium]NGZ05393.1 spermidine/putrescine ABC transporter substrate-binding protein [Magnetococcales bacterium]
MRHHLFVAMLVCCLFYSLFGMAEANKKKEIVLLNWSEYMDPELLQQFEKKTGIHVREVNFETDETRDELLTRTGGKGFDLFVVSGERVQSYVNRKWLARLDTRLLPNTKHIAPRWITAYPDLEKFAVPIFWGTLGIGYRTDLVADNITKWQQLLQPAEKLRQRIVMEKESRDLMGVAMKIQGHTWNHYEEAAIEQAEKLLMAQKPFVRAYGYPSLDKTSGLVTGEVWMAMLYNGDAISLKELEPRIDYVVPEEGTMLWVDCLVVLESSPRKAMAYAFIDFLHEPDNAAQLAHHLHYATVNQAAELLLKPEHKNNPVIYPPDAILKRSEFLIKPPPQIDRRFKEILRGLLNESIPQ